MQESVGLDICELFTVEIKEIVQSRFMHLFVAIRNYKIQLFSNKLILANVYHTAESTTNCIYG